MSNPQILNKPCQVKIRITKNIARKYKLLTYVKVAMLSLSHFSLLYLTIGMGASVALFSSCLNTAIAQTSPAATQMGLSETTISQVNVLFVNPSVGEDKQSNGNENNPLKTITYALQVAKPNTVVMLAKGTYSAETGETFPLILKSGVTVQGETATKGGDIIITGGGNYLSRSFGSKNVAIIGAKEAKLIGVTVTNSNPRGYGLWIESTNLTVTDNTFTGSIQDGVAVTGNAKPMIRNNYFYRNGANGITITGTSRAEIRENVFQDTGFGINVAQKAEPILVGNQIQNNRSGIIVQADARPLVRNNLIQDSKEDGLVAIAQAQPDLGSASQPGGNEFRNNKRYDINANAAKQTIPAFGNKLTTNLIAGAVDLQGLVAVNRSEETQPSPEVSLSAPSVSTSANPSQPSASASLRSRLSRSNTNNSGQSPRQLLPNSPSTRTTNRPKPSITSKAATISVPSSLAGRSNSGVGQANSSETPQINYVQISNNTVEFVAPNVQSAPNQLRPASNQRQSLPALESPAVGKAAPLPVPRRVLEPATNNTTAYASGQAGQLPRGTRYRVMATIQTQRDQELVRFLAPGAFPTFWQGQAVMQAGVFSSQSNAEQMLDILKNNGLKGTVEPIGN